MDNENSCQFVKFSQSIVVDARRIGQLLHLYRKDKQGEHSVS
jgi:hypothetical protein